MEHFTWTLGEPMQRSIKTVKNQKETRELALEESSDSINHFKDSNVREKMNDKLTDRYMVKQMGQNPFLSDSTYLNDLQIQEQFLRPKSSHSENNDNK